MNSEIHLRKLEEKDIPGMLEWMHDPEVNRWFRFDAAAMNKESVKDFISKSFTENNRHYAIADASDEYLGTISLEDIDRENSHALYAVSLRKAAWGKGVALAATKKILKIAFEEIGLERVYLNVLSDNIRAKCMYEKAGFRYEGCFRKHLKLRGEWHNWDWYSILREEYPSEAKTLLENS